MVNRTEYTVHHYQYVLVRGRCTSVQCGCAVVRQGEQGFWRRAKRRMYQMHQMHQMHLLWQCPWPTQQSTPKLGVPSQGNSVLARQQRAPRRLRYPNQSHFCPFSLPNFFFLILRHSSILPVALSSVFAASSSCFVSCLEPAVSLCSVTAIGALPLPNLPLSIPQTLLPLAALDQQVQTVPIGKICAACTRTHSNRRHSGAFFHGGKNRLVCLPLRVLWL
jgi:hypothetical protein